MLALSFVSTQIYGEEAPPEEKLAAPAAPAAVPLPQQQREFASAPEHGEGVLICEDARHVAGYCTMRASIELLIIAFDPADLTDADHSDSQLSGPDRSLAMQMAQL